MNLNLRKTVLLTGAFAFAGLCPSTDVYAYSPGQAASITQQVRTVTGTVKDAEGPIIGATITEKGTQNGVISDLDGNFSLQVKPGATLVISYVGYETQEIAVGSSSSVSVTLQTADKSLDEVVVVGYGVQKKKLVTGATVQVKGDDVAKLNTTNALDAIQASSPGVQIVTASNQPGQGFKVNIRGLGTTGDAAPLVVIDGVAGGSLDNVNPADIESIDVLKDAASAAIYGARAANGVILVTTKQGKTGKVEFSYDGYMGWSNVYKRPNLLNAQQYMQVMDEYSFNTTGNVMDWTTQMPADIYQRVKDGWQGTDWWDLYANKNALQTSHTFNLTGGSERSKFALGVSYTSNDGIMGKPLESKYDRYTTRINSTHVLLKAKDHDVITLGENISLYYNKSKQLAESGIYWNSIHSTLTACPLVPAYNEDGTLYQYDTNGKGWNTNMFGNPLAALINGNFDAVNRFRNFGMSTTFFADIEPIRDLRLHSQINVGYSTSVQRHFYTPYSESAISSFNNYRVSQYQNSGSSYDWVNTLSYKLPELLKDNSFDAMIGFEYSATDWGEDLSADNSDTDATRLSTLTDFSHAYLTNTSADYADAHISGAPWPDNAILSYFGRVNWNMKETYMATFTLRADGSSNFARGHRWGWFPSASVGWVVSNENFMKSTASWLDFLKLRASWGQNGNCNIANFNYVSSIAYSNQYHGNAYRFENGSPEGTVAPSSSLTPGAYASRLPNPDVTWETSEQTDLGFDATVLNSRLTVNFDWYNKTTKDWLIAAPILDIYGTSAPYINGGDVKNTGFEIGVSWNDRIGKDFRYHINANMSYNKNEVTRIANTEGIINGPTNLLAQSTDYFYRAQVGYPIGYFYGMSTEGVWQTQEQIDQAVAAGKAVAAGARPGDLIWVDGDGDGTINYASDRHQIGNPNPDVFAGLSFGFEYKGFDFNVTTHGAFGQQIMRSYRSFVDSWFQNYTEDVYTRWHGAGTSNKQPRLCAGSDPNNQWISDRYMENGDYLKIQNVTLGYDFNHIWKSSPFQQLRLYFQAQNLYTFTNYSGSDPEIGSSAGTAGWASGIDLGLYPSSRTYLVGVSIKF